MKRIMKALTGALILALLLSGCSAPADTSEDANAVLVYRLAVNPETEGSLVVPERFYPPEGVNQIQFAIGAVLAEAVTPELVSAFPGEFAIQSYSVAGSEVFIYFGRAYLELVGVDRTAANCCLTLTLCALEGVDSVSIYVDGMEEAVALGLTPEELVLVDDETNPGERSLRMFFPAKGKSFLTSEYHTLSVEVDKPLHVYVVEELMRGPADPGLLPVFPEGSQLLGISAENRVCTLNLSSEFFDGRPGKLLDARLSLYAIVNSLTSLSEVESVRILVDGKSPLSYTYIPLGEPLMRNEEIVARNTLAGSEREVRLYMRAGDTAELAAIPRVVRIEDSAEPAQSVIRALVSDSGEWGFTGLFSESDEGITASVSGGIARVYLPEGFFTSRDDEQVQPALRALALTLLDLRMSARVVFETNYDISGFRGLELEYSRVGGIFDDIVE